HGEHSPSGSLFSYAFAPQGVPGIMNGLSTADFLWNIQCNVIQQLADKGPCVIVGRNADYILKDRPECLHIYTFADVPFRATAAVADVIGALLVPTGAFFPPLTVTAVLRGILYGIMLKYVPEYMAKVIDDPKKYQRAWIGVCAATTLFDQLAFGMLLQSYWLSLLYGSPYTGMMASRVLQIAILIPVEFVVLVFLPRLTDKLQPYLQSSKKGR
ncbi:MAG: folate family ECF transporter S component, partial [Clostridia bacterium]|nr:folate family ECF transporter S component [Clostridia bacterium]